MKQSIRVIIGGAYGDEGKGLVTDLFSAQNASTLVIKHNGGAQSGHTVEYLDEHGLEKRFVFHELSSGSFRGADTLWADKYLPDLYKLSEEMEAFSEVSGFKPSVYACENTCITLIDDVLLNMAAECARGEKRHGSCGMGIYEAVLRNQAGFPVTVKQVKELPLEDLVERMRGIRKEYLPLRLKELGLSLDDPGEYGELLQSDNVLVNAAVEMKRGAQYVELIKEKRSFMERYGNVIFESGQGLLLDWDYEPGFPHVSASKTGLDNPLQFLRECGLKPDEVIYVVRSYLTRHGAGPLPHECGGAELGHVLSDETNVPNPWQGTLRYSRYDSLQAMLQPMAEDFRKCRGETKASLCITHLNETEGKLRFATGDLTVDEFVELPRVSSIFSQIYLSNTKYSRDITCMFPPFCV